PPLQSIRHAKHPAEVANILTEHQHVAIPFQHDIERRVERLNHVHRHDQTPSVLRCSSSRQSGSTNTSSNMPALSGFDLPSVPTASASFAAASTCSVTSTLMA